MTERTTVRLPDDLLRRAKRKAAAEGRTLTSLVEDGLRRVISDSAKTVSKKPPNIPVSGTRGWLLPGVDITKFSDIQGMDDFEYAARLKDGFK